MAGIEKVDEYDSEYHSYDMYRYKRNNIQVAPKNRKFFAKQDHILVIKKTDDHRVYTYKGGGYSTFIPEKTAKFDLHNVTTPVYLTEDLNRTFKWKGKGWYDFKRTRRRPFSYLHKIKVVSEYEFDLYCPNLKGRVDGHYLNWTSDISATKRKLKKLLKLKKMNIVYLNDSKLDIEECAEKLYKSHYGIID